LVATDALDQVPTGLRRELLSALQTIALNFAQHRWEPSELNGGKLCEVVYSIVEGALTGSFPARAKKPQNMVDACRKLEQIPGGTRALRVQIPRVLMALYEIRNNRGVGHVGGDVEPNHMDALLVLEMSKWLVADLVRHFHTVDIDTATLVVESLIERSLPIVWDVEGVRRVLDHSLGQRDRTLLLLYASVGPVAENDLVAWVEAKNTSAYRRDVLRKLHAERLVEFNEKSRAVHMSPKGTSYVETHLPLQLQ
jgi:hypothetical protein